MRMCFNGKESELPPQIGNPETASVSEKEVLRIQKGVKKETEKESLGDKSTYCTICSKQIEKYGRKKEACKNPGWVFCPKHGWIQEGVHDRQIGSEKPIRFFIEEVPEDHDEQEKPFEQEEQRKTSFSDKRKQLRGYLSTTIAENKAIVLSMIVSVISLIIIVILLLGYFVWKSSPKEIREIQSLQLLFQNEDLTTSQAESGVYNAPQASVPVEKSPDNLEFTISPPIQNAVSENSTKSFGEKIKNEVTQVKKPLVPQYTIQIGAFTNFSHAKSLKGRLDKKGYNAYISFSKSSREEGHYKVWIGKFSTKAQADSLAAKIKNTERIQTFVTSW